MLFEFAGTGDGNGTVTARFDIVWSPASGQQFHALDNAQGMRVVRTFWEFRKDFVPSEGDLQVRTAGHQLRNLSGAGPAKVRVRMVRGEPMLAEGKLQRRSKMREGGGGGGSRRRWNFHKMRNRTCWVILMSPFSSSRLARSRPGRCVSPSAHRRLRTQKGSDQRGHQDHDQRR